MPEIDEKEHERLKEQLDELRSDVRELIASAYIESMWGGEGDRTIVGDRAFAQLQADYDRQQRDRAERESDRVPYKREPDILMREALEWILQPTEAIGSNAEFHQKAQEKAKRALNG